MIKAKKNSSTGPKTRLGKKVSSQNALVHGANSLQVVGSRQRDALEAFVRELTEYYQPSSPLEKLQIERIALCKVKLDALYELELVKLQIAGEDLSRSPNLVMQRVSMGDKLTQSFALTISNGRPLTLPMGLTQDLLEKIASEINVVGGKLGQDDDMHVAMPMFVSFADELASKLGISRYSAILRLNLSVNEMLKAGGEIFGQILELLEDIREKEHRNDEQICLANSDQASDVEKDVETEKINETLGLLSRLNNVLQNAKVLAENFTRMRDLMMQSVTLSGEESDRLMRYQTTWERRLSSAIGELLTLQGRRNP